MGAHYENWKRERSPAYHRRRNEDSEGKKDETKETGFIYS